MLGGWSVAELWLFLRCTFVFEQFPFYTILLIEFLMRTLQLDLVSEQGATLVFRVMKIFAQPGLMAFIQRGKHPRGVS